MTPEFTNPPELPESAFYKKKLLLSMLIPGMLVSVMILARISESLLDLDLSDGGIFPGKLRGVPGIFFSPFIHKDFEHLFNNALPLFLLATALFFFYSAVAFRVLIINYLATGLMVWLWGREAWHLGASGLVYGLASFLFFSGIIKKYFRLIALSLLVVFLYGEMVWGIFPGIYENISWESHMLGFISGLFLALWYRNEGPQAPVYEWMTEDEEEDEEKKEVNGPDGNYSKL